VFTHASYGYACACLNVTVDQESMRVLRVHSAQQRRLKDCLEDKAIPAPYGKECR
jgi:hypothetical protein